MRKQETRKRRVRKSRRHRHKRSHRHKSHKRSHRRSHKQQGGDYAKDFTGESIVGMPYTKDAVVVTGQDVMKAEDLQEHWDYRDRQGPRQ